MGRSDLISIIVAIGLTAGCSSKRPPAVTDVRSEFAPLTPQALLGHVEFLADDALEGRKAGTAGARRAATYIRNQLAYAGLEPAGESYYQSFPFSAEIELGPGNQIAWRGATAGQLRPGIDFRPLVASPNAAVSGQLVFAGYGKRDDEIIYDDYADIDMGGKIALLLSPGPLLDDEQSQTNRRKQVLTARLQGAGAVLLVHLGSSGSPYELPVLIPRSSPAQAGIPTALLTQAAADSLLAGERLTVEDLRREIDTSRLPFSHEIRGLTVSLTTNVTAVEDTSRNVVAVLPGKGKLKDQWLIVGAHYDHVGMGGPGSGSAVPLETAIHNGADDNASGVALLIDVARYLSANQPKGTRRTMVFQAFGAEEPGLWGSKYAAVHPPLPIETVTAMVNMDMVGRLRQNRLSIHGAGSSSEWPSLVNTVNTDQLLLDFTAQPQGASDHLTYFLREKPVLHLTTGGHDQYHTPDDDVGLINYKGMSRIGGLVARLVSDLATRPEPLPVNPVVPE